MSVLYFYLFLLVHPYIAMWWKSFPQADRKSWEALVPVYNYFVVFKLGAKKPWWSLLLIFPGVHLVMWAVGNVSYIRRFGYYSLIDTLQGILFPYIILFKIAQSGDKILPETNWANSKEVSQREWGDHLVLFLCVPVLGHIIALAIAAVTRAKPGKKTKVKEWGDSLLFALVAASIIRTYVFEPFQIPTGSMEKTLVVGDFLFVNKLAYGPKVPVTPLSYPLVHNTVPWINVRSYTTLETSEYTRLPGFGKINRNDVVVFNYPSGDTAVYDPRMPTGLMGHDYHGIVIREAKRLFEESTVSKQEYQRAFTHYKDSLTIINRNRPDSLQVDMSYAQYLAEDFQYKQFIRNLDQWKAKARKMIAEDKLTYDQSLGKVISHYGIVPRPVDKRENYIKRCVGVPGDWIEIKYSVLYVNDKAVKQFEHQNLKYISSMNFVPDATHLKSIGLEIERRDYRRGIPEFDEIGDSLPYILHLTTTQLAEIKKRNPGTSFTVERKPQYSDNSELTPTGQQMCKNLEFFPKDPYVNNTNTDFNRFQIPKKGQTIKINKDNIAWYRRIIRAYEGHKLEEKKDGIYIDGKKTSTYTFGMNYYWMMGDNRYNSADSRVWGFVPEDHIVGKASMVWFSRSPYAGIRTERVFTLIK